MHLSQRLVCPVCGGIVERPYPDTGAPLGAATILCPEYHPFLAAESGATTDRAVVRWEIFSQRLRNWYVASSILVVVLFTVTSASKLDEQGRFSGSTYALPPLAAAAFFTCASAVMLFLIRRIPTRQSVWSALISKHEAKSNEKLEGTPHIELPSVLAVYVLGAIFAWVTVYYFDWASPSEIPSGIVKHDEVEAIKRQRTLAQAWIASHTLAATFVAVFFSLLGVSHGVLSLIQDQAWNRLRRTQLEPPPVDIGGRAIAFHPQIWLIQIAVRIRMEFAHFLIDAFGYIVGTDTGWRRTPLDNWSDSTGIVVTTPSASRKYFDLFVSYKSEDVMRVRPIVDLLLASGLRVWFAEYAITLDRATFQSAIDRGVESARCAIAFTGPQYANSNHCENELKKLLMPDNCGPARVLQVCMADHRGAFTPHPKLSQSPTILWNGKSNELLSAIARITTCDISMDALVEEDSEQQAIYYDPILGYRICVGRWQLVRPGRMRTGSDSHGPTFRHSLDGRRAEWNLIVDSPAPSPRGIVTDGRALNDHACFDQLCGMARVFEDFSGTRCIGTHLVLRCQEGHVALTYWFWRYWTRRYSVVLDDPRSGTPVEFAFTFKFYGPFSEYCRHTREMDRIVASLDW